MFELLATPSGTIHLGIQTALPDTPGLDLSERVLHLLRQTPLPQTRTAIREALRLNNQRLGDTLQELGLISPKVFKEWCAWSDC